MYEIINEEIKQRYGTCSDSTTKQLNNIRLLYRIILLRFQDLKNSLPQKVYT